MAVVRKELEKKEMEALAAYAVKSAESKGRRYDEPKHPYRTEFQRDRDRIVHSTAFRRLEYKTQVFVNHEGDHYRTRLTHTLEVAYIARSIARALRLNEDLTEAIALAHDLGHTPFGHSGEEALNDLLRDHGGFEHNLQGLRVVDRLETRYPDFPGLNLTFELREGILKHHSHYDDPRVPDDLKLEPNPSLECQVVNMADEIAYNCHDIDDGLSSGILNEEQLKDVSAWRRHRELLKESYPGIDDKMRRHIIVRKLINDFVTDLSEQSTREIEALNPSSADDVRRAGKSLLSFSLRVHDEGMELKEFLYDNMYRHRKLEGMAKKARTVVSELYERYVNNPRLLPVHITNLLKTETAYRVVADYVAGMTDRFAASEYEKIRKSRRIS
jgi:dGTPase